MIELLDLGCNFLSNRRKEALEDVFDPPFIESATPQELEMLTVAFRQPDAHGQLSNFGHVVSRYADQLRTP
jgi:hypothetical protein